LTATLAVDERAGRADSHPSESVLTEVRHAASDRRRSGKGTHGGLHRLQHPNLGIGTPPVTCSVSRRFRRHVPTPSCWSGRGPPRGTASSSRGTGGRVRGADEVPRRATPGPAHGRAYGR